MVKGRGPGWHGDTPGHRRAALKGLYKSGKRPSIFFEGKGKYSKIVSFASPIQANKAAQELLFEFRSAKTRTKRVRVLRVAVLAANRAKATTKRKNLSATKKRDLRLISEAYRDAADRMGNVLALKK